MYEDKPHVVTKHCARQDASARHEGTLQLELSQKPMSRSMRGLKPRREGQLRERGLPEEVLGGQDTVAIF